MKEMEEEMARPRRDSDTTPVEEGMSVPEPSISYVYIGDGAYLVGVPAHDLTAEEAAENREAIEASGLYRRKE